jgi:hypothetical protein
MRKSTVVKLCSTGCGRLVNARDLCGVCYMRAKRAGTLTVAGPSGHPLYATWCNMMTRCYNPIYNGTENYSGRGITVCDRWHDFSSFAEDIERLIGLRPEGDYSLDRINNDGNYEEGNVKWSTRDEQNRNSRLKRDAKLDAGKALEIKLRLAAGETGVSIALDMGVSTATVSLIKSGKHWGWVELPVTHQKAPDNDHNPVVKKG